MNKKRILYVEKPGFVGGSITGLYDLIRGLDCERYEPMVLFYNPNPFAERFREIGVRTEILSNEIPPAGRNKRDIAGALGRVSGSAGNGYATLKDFYRFMRRGYPVAQKIAGVIRTWEIDLVHHNNCLRTDRASVLGARMAGVPQIQHVRSLRPFGRLGRMLAHSVNRFIYMSRATETLYHQHGIPAAQGQVIYDGFASAQVAANGNHTNGHAPAHSTNHDSTNHDSTNHHASASNRDAYNDVRAQLGLAADDFVISNVGRIDWWKGHEYFVRSIADVVRQQPKTKALVVGGVDSTMRNAAYHQEVLTMVQQLGLDEHVIFTGFRSDVPQIMAMSDLIVHSASEPEPFGRVVVEAMLAARPVVATAAGGVLDIVEDQVIGLTVPPKDAAAMAGAIQFLLQNPTQARAMGERAQQEARRRFSVEQHVAGVQRVYEHVLAEGRK